MKDMKKPLAVYFEWASDVEATEFCASDLVLIENIVALSLASRHAEAARAMVKESWGDDQGHPMDLAEALKVSKKLRKMAVTNQI